MPVRQSGWGTCMNGKPYGGGGWSYLLMHSFSSFCCHTWKEMQMEGGRGSNSKDFHDYLPGWPVETATLRPPTHACMHASYHAWLAPSTILRLDGEGGSWALLKWCAYSLLWTASRLPPRQASHLRAVHGGKADREVGGRHQLQHVGGEHPPPARRVRLHSHHGVPR